jgi:hypothetical protein
VGLLFLPLILYPIALAAMHVPMMVAYFVLKRFQLLKPWHFMFACAAVFGPAHWLYGALFFGQGNGLAPIIFGVSLGFICGGVWWYVLVKRVGTGASLPSASKNDRSYDPTA